MGCKCKDTAKTVRKYSGGETLETVKGVERFVFAVRRLFTVVLALLVFIIAIPFVLIAGIVKRMKGEKPKLDLKKIIRTFHVKGE